MYSRNNTRMSSRRVPKSVFLAMSPAQRAAKSRAVNRSKKFTSTRNSKMRMAPTIGGPRVGQTLLTTVPLFPVRKYVKGQLYYEPYVNLNASLGSMAVYNISANDLYDPNRTGTGHQPIGFDQMMSMYEQFCVVRSHIKVTFINAGDDAARVSIILSPDTQVPPSITAAMENGLLTTSVICGSGTSAGNERIKTLQLTCDVPKYFGKPYSAIIADPLQSGNISSSPAEQVYFQVLVWDPFTTAVDATVALDITVSYDTLYWEPKKLSSS